MASRKRKLEEKEGDKKKWKAEMKEELKKFIKRHPRVYSSDKRWKISTAYCPLHVAVYYGRDDLVRYLIQEKGVDVNRRHKRKHCLAIAIKEGRLSTAKLLLELGANVDTRDAEGNGDALVVAVAHRNRPMIRLLVEHGAKITPHTIMRLQHPERKRGIVFIRDLLMEKLFSNVIVGGICSSGKFRDFLGEGVYDPRLLIHIASFTYN